MLSVHTVLYPTDFSVHSAHAFQVACALARDYSAELVIAHVAPHPVQAIGDGMTIELPTGWEEAVKTRLETIHPKDSAVRHTYRLAVGDAADEIVRLAGELHADLIVMDTHGRSGLSRLLMGSVAEHVLRHAPCPVITVRRALTPDPTAETPETAGTLRQLSAV